MTECLVVLLDDWKGTLMVAMFFLFYGVYFFAGTPPPPGVIIPEHVKNRIIGPYAVTMIFMCRVIIGFGIEFYKKTYNLFTYAPPFSFIIMIIYFYYAIMLFINTCNMSNFKPKSLTRARKILLFTPLLLAIHTFILDHIIYLTNSSKKFDTLTSSFIFIVSCLAYAIVFWSWLAYFAFSHEIKDLSQQIDATNKTAGDTADSMT